MTPVCLRNPLMKMSELHIQMNLDSKAGLPPFFIQFYIPETYCNALLYIKAKLGPDQQIQKLSENLFTAFCVLVTSSMLKLCLFQKWYKFISFQIDNLHFYLLLKILSDPDPLQYYNVFQCLVSNSYLIRLTCITFLINYHCS